MIEPKSPMVTINNELSKYDNMPIFQKKLDEANAFLAEHPPLFIFREGENKRIKAYFEQGMSIDQIARNLEFSENEVLMRLEEMDLVKSVHKDNC